MSLNKGGSSQPQAPDPQQTSAAQTQSNVATARVQGRMNRNNVNNPYYTTTWTDMGDRTRKPDGSPVTPPIAAGDPAPGGGAARQPINDGYQGEHYTREDGTVMAGPDPRAGPLAQSRSASGGAAGSGDPNDPLAGEQEYYDQDRWQQTTTLNPEEQRILDQSRRLQLGTGDIAEGQLPKIRNALDTTTTYDKLPENVGGVDYSKLQAVNANFARDPMVKSLTGAGTDVQTNLSGVGNGVRTSLGDTGSLVRSVNPDGQWDYNDVGGPKRSLGTPDYTMQQALVGNAIYDQGASRLDPTWGRRESELTQNLADRGIAEGSDLYNSELDRFSRERTDAYDTLGRTAITGSGDELSRLAGLDLAKFRAENDAQNLEFGQTAVQRGDLLGKDLSLGKFANDASGQAFSEELARGNFNNAGEGQLFGQELARFRAENDAQQQILNNEVTGAEFKNRTQQQDFAQQQAQQQLAAQLRAQGLTEQQINAALAAQARSAGYTERENVRTQPIRDTQTLMAG